MLFGSFTGKVVDGQTIVLEVPSNQDGVKATIILDAYGSISDSLKALDKKQATVSGILLRDKETRNIVIQVQSVSAASKSYAPKSFPVSAVVTATDSKIGGNEKPIVTLSAYSTNPGRDSGFTGINLKFYNPTNKMISLLESVSEESNKTQLYTVGNLDFYVGEASEGGVYTVISIWNRQFELLRGGSNPNTKGSKATAPVTATAADDDDF